MGFLFCSVACCGVGYVVLQLQFPKCIIYKDTVHDDYYYLI